MQWLLIVWLAMDLAAIKTEPNLERRSQLALDNANVALASARDAFSSGDNGKAQAAVDEVGESVDVAYESLQKTGKSARRSPKFFKRAELATRDLMRRLDGMRDSLSVADRPMVESVRDRVARVHDELIEDLMGRKNR